VPGHHGAEHADQPGRVLLPLQPPPGPVRVGEVQHQRVPFGPGQLPHPEQPVEGPVEGQHVPAGVLHRGRERVELAQQRGQERGDVLVLLLAGRLGHLGQREQVAPLVRVEQQRVGDGLQHLGRRANRPSLLQPGVPGHPDRGQLGDLLAAQPRRAAAVGRPDADRLRADPFPAAAQEGGELPPAGLLTVSRGRAPGARGYRHRHRFPVSFPVLETGHAGQRPRSPARQDQPGHTPRCAASQKSR
jgi:hypothetical protein